MHGPLVRSEEYSSSSADPADSGYKAAKEATRTSLTIDLLSNSYHASSHCCAIFGSSSRYHDPGFEHVQGSSEACCDGARDTPKDGAFRRRVQTLLTPIKLCLPFGPCSLGVFPETELDNRKRDLSQNGDPPTSIQFHRHCREAESLSQTHNVLQCEESRTAKKPCLRTLLDHFCGHANGACGNFTERGCQHVHIGLMSCWHVLVDQLSLDTIVNHEERRRRGHRAQ